MSDSIRSPVQTMSLLSFWGDGGLESQRTVIAAALSVSNGHIFRKSQPTFCLTILTQKWGVDYHPRRTALQLRYVPFSIYSLSLYHFLPPSFHFPFTRIQSTAEENQNSRASLNGSLKS